MEEEKIERLLPLLKCVFSEVSRHSDRPNKQETRKHSQQQQKKKNCKRAPDFFQCDLKGPVMVITLELVTQNGR